MFYVIAYDAQEMSTPADPDPPTTKLSEVFEVSEFRIPNETHAHKAGGNLAPKQPEAQTQQAADESHQEPCGLDSGISWHCWK